MKKINVGCGWECREGWINVDNTQKPQRVNYPLIFMDATKTWPYDDNYFDYVLSEHMIEHLKEPDGLFMLREALRTLKLNGVVRISCPNRTFYEGLHNDDNHPFVDAYCRKIFRRSPRHGDAKKTVQRSLELQGHVWVPTGNQLIQQLEKAGFKDVKLCEYGTSEHDVFNGIELSDGIRELETICVEGVKK